MSATNNTAATVRWGFIGCGRIAHDFAMAMAPLTTAKLQACAARSVPSAEKFAVEHGFAKAYGSYEALCSDPEVDIVYVATLSTSHAEHAMLALNHGKHVLVEKPMAMNAKEASQVISLAKEKGLFFMEGMWTRFFPATHYIRKLLAEGAIGEVQHVQADMCYDFDTSIDNMWKRALGGGGLIGVGIYPLSFVTMVFGTEPEKVTAVGKLTPDKGVDAYGSVTLEYGGHKFATFQYSMSTQLSETAMILGSKGRITVSMFHTPTKVVLTRYGAQGEDTKTLFPRLEVEDGKSFNYFGSEGFVYQAEGVTNAILAKQTEASEYTPAEMLGIHKLMDTIRQQLGVVYDADNH